MYTLHKIVQSLFQFLKIFLLGLKGIRQIRRQSSTNFNEGLKQWIKGVDFVDKVILIFC